MQNVYNQMPPIIVNELLKDVILYFSGLVMVKSLWKDNTAKVIIETVPVRKSMKVR